MLSRKASAEMTTAVGFNPLQKSVTQTQASLRRLRLKLRKVKNESNNSDLIDI